MSVILERLNKKFQILLENEIDTSWKDPDSGEYDRQWAEDALYHTVGPLTDSPRWVSPKLDAEGNRIKNKEGKEIPVWSSPSEPVPGFVPGGPAPRWTEQEIIYAFAGDPALLFSGRRNSPTSPEYGNKGGAPLLRIARKVARIYNRATDRQFIADLYSNGFVPLMKMMKPGYDEARGPFISFVMKNVESAMQHSTGGSKQSDLAGGIEGETRKGSGKIVGFAGLLNKDNPQEIREIANQVKGKYREQSSHDKHDDNPLGKYSASFYNLANQYADVLDMGDEDLIDATRNQIRQKISDIKDDNVSILGASTGLGQAISTPDRVKKDEEGEIKNPVKIASMDAPVAGGDGVSGMAGNMMGDDGEDSSIDPETITYILDIAINQDLGEIIGKIPKYAAMAQEFGAKEGKIGGKMLANEFRYFIRTLGPLGSNYPGKGKIRRNTGRGGAKARPNIPRDATGWWEPGSDPEIEPIPEAPLGTVWHSIWSRDGYQSMGPTEIKDEMTQEVLEFNQLGIPTARIVKSKKDSRTGRENHEAISKVAVHATLEKAMIKIKFIAILERDQIGMDESQNNNIHPLLESIAKTDHTDRKIIAEACDRVCAKIRRVLSEESPPGWKKTVEHMKKDEGIDDDTAFAFAWSTYNKNRSRPDNKKKKKRKNANESVMKPVDALILET